MTEKKRTSQLDTCPLSLYIPLITRSFLIMGYALAA